MLTYVKNHAPAGRVNVSLRSRDEARGLDPHLAAGDASGGSTIGQTGIQERPRLLEMTGSVRSQPGRGMEVIARIPFHLKSWAP